MATGSTWISLSFRTNCMIRSILREVGVDLELKRIHPKAHLLYLTCAFLFVRIATVAASAYNLPFKREGMLVTLPLHLCPSFCVVPFLLSAQCEDSVEG